MLIAMLVSFQMIINIIDQNRLDYLSHCYSSAPTCQQLSMAYKSNQTGVHITKVCLADCPCNMMISTSEINFKFKKTYLQITYFQPGPNNSIVFIGLLGTKNDKIQEFLVHLNDDESMFQHKLEDSVFSLAITDNSEAVVLEVTKNRILILDLIKHTIRYCPYQFMTEVSCQCDIEVFRDTKLVCIRQNGTYNDSRLKLTYLTYPLTKDTLKLKVGDFNSEELEDAQWSFEYCIRKGNNHSMILWFKPRHDDNFEIKCVQVKQKELVFKNYIIKNSLGDLYNINKIDCAVGTVWQMRSHELLLVCNTSKTEKELVNSHGVVNNNFIWHLETNTIREAKFWFDPNFNDFLIDEAANGSYSVFHTYLFDQNGPLESPVYYIDNNSETIIHQENWKCSHLSKCLVPAHLQDTFAEALFENTNVSQLRLVVKTVVKPKYHSLFIALKLYKDFDENLLADCMGLLQPK